MDRRAEKKGLTRAAVILLGTGLAAVVLLLCLPWPAAEAAGIPDGAVLGSVTVVRATVPDAPEMVTVQDREDCLRLANCLRELGGRWSGFSGKTFVQDHGVSYTIYFSRPDEQPAVCRLFDGKLYCGSFRFALSGGDAARLTQCITELMERYAET